MARCNEVRQRPAREQRRLMPMPVAARVVVDGAGIIQICACRAVMKKLMPQRRDATGG